MEKILCAAIWYKELPTPLYRPINIDIGSVFCGYSHMHCLHQMYAITGKRSVTSEVGEYIQGFLTDKNRFVDRKEAAKIALDTGQIKKSLKHLFSEDLY
jgi:hypothetical protein